MKTKVIFRKEFPENGGNILAVFPTLAGDNNPYRTCLCYAHLGQHGTMDIDYLKSTFPCNDTKEFSDLYDELTAIVGYDLKISKRFSRKDLLSRIEQTKG